MYTMSNPKLTKIAQNLRKHMTKEECKLWFEFLQPLPVVIKRQRVIGNYIVDFYCPAAKLVIEIDGSQHYEEQGKAKDQQRDSDLEALGLKVLRYSNYDVNHSFEAVCEDILQNPEMQTALRKGTDSPR